MPARKVVFDDATSITMLDRETLLYEEANYSVAIWFDFMPRFFSRGRILHKSSIQQWKDFPSENDPNISAAKQDEIIEKVRKYWLRAPVEIE